MSQTQYAQNFWDRIDFAMSETILILKRLFLIIFIFFVVLLVTACDPETRYSAAPIDRTPLNLPDPPSVQLQEVDWMIVTEYNIRGVLDDLTENGQKRVLFAVSQGDFQKMTENLQELGSVIILYRETLGQYRVYYEPSED